MSTEQEKKDYTIKPKIEGEEKGMSKQGKILLVVFGVMILIFVIVIFTSGTGDGSSVPTLSGSGAAAEVIGIPANLAPSQSMGHGDNTPIGERLAAQQMDIEEMRRVLMNMQQLQGDVFREFREQLSAIQSRDLSSPRAVASEQLSQLQRPSTQSERYTADYQVKVSRFKSNRGNFWALSDGEVREMQNARAATALIRPQIIPVIHDDLLGGAMFGGEVPIEITGNTYTIPAGSRVFAITEQPVNSDHPGFFTSRIIRPEILRGALLICQHGGQTNERIPVNVNKIIMRGTEYTVSAQIEMGFPGVTGRVRRHWGKRAGPIITNAAITGGFVAWSANNRGNDRIDTRDAITAEVVGATLPEIQREIAKFGVDRPPTVEVASGAQFSILLLNPLTVRF